MKNNKASVHIGTFLLYFMFVFSLPGYAADWDPLPDTGQKGCTDAGDQALIPCPGVFDPFYGQDANYQGKQQDLQNNGDGTLTDQNTGLVWSLVYPPSDGESPDWNAAAAWCNKLDHAGRIDWRLPEIFELHSLLDFSRYPRIAEEVLDMNDKYFFSATTYAPDAQKFWTVDTRYGELATLSKGSANFTRCVRGDSQLPGQYLYGGDAVSDRSTYLDWQRVDDGQLRTWEQALAYCESLSLDKMEDWRLPNIRELISLVDFSTSSPSLDTSYFPLPTAGSIFWSSTTALQWLTGAYAGAEAVDFADGSSSMRVGGEPKDSTLATRCVRDGLLEYFDLSVVLAGTGSGKVQSGEGTIDCGTSCSGVLQKGTELQLNAVADAGSSFVTWSGNFIGSSDCEGNTGTCSIMALDDSAIAAYFMPHKELSVAKDGIGAGFVVSTPVGILCGDSTPGDCNQHYVFGTDVSLTAVPQSASSFWYWGGDDCSGTSTGCIVNMDRERNAIAYFRPNFIALYPLEVVKLGTGDGNVTSVPQGIDCGTDCFEQLPAGSEITLTAQPLPGSIFSGWGGFPCFGVSTTCTVTMSHEWKQSATFTADTSTPRSLTVSIIPNSTGNSGKVTSAPAGIDCGTDCAEEFAYNTSVALTATPDPGSGFAGWSGDGCSGTSPLCTVSMDRVREVSAEFGIAPPQIVQLLQLRWDGGGVGGVTSNPAGIDCTHDCDAFFGHNTLVSLSAEPIPGSEFSGWLGEGCSGTAKCDLIMDQLRSVTATFDVESLTRQPLTVSLEGNSNGSVTSFPAGISCGADCAESFDYDTLVSLEALADSGNMFLGWAGAADCANAGQGSCVVLMSHAKDVQAYFQVASVPLCSGNIPVIDGHYFWSGTHFHCEAGTSITAQNNTILENYSRVELVAPVIELKPLFRVKGGGVLSVSAPSP